MRRLPALVALFSVLAVILFVQFPTAAQSLPQVLVSGVAPNQSSVRVFYAPFAGAKDYRVYDVANPSDVKYAGMAHYMPANNCPGSYCGSTFATDASGNVLYPLQVVTHTSVQSGPDSGLDVPAYDIEWNLNDGAQHALVVQAVDALGPTPQHNLYPWACCGAHTAIFPPAGMLGSNKGVTADGNTSTNGQGPYTNAPNVIAQSQPFVVQANQAYTPLGKIAGASQPFLDTFDNSEAPTIAKVDQNTCGDNGFNNLGFAHWTMGAGTAKAWNITINSADFDDTMPFISNSHFMDMLFDGATAGKCNAPSDTTYSALAMSPAQSADMTSGGILHLTMEVDAHQSFRRWMAFNLSPVSDPIQGFNSGTGEPINKANNALFFETRYGGAAISVYNGSTTPATASCGVDQLYIDEDFSEMGRGLDDRSKMDLFVSKTHYAFFEDDKLVCQGDLPGGGMSWFNQPLSSYFTHYLYHSDADISDMRGFVLSGGTFAYPMNSYWFNDPQNGTAASANSANIAYPAGYGFPHSDERHWDNMGFEVVPNTGDFSSFGSSVALDKPQPPQFTGGSTPTNTPVTSTPSPVPTSTVVPTSCVVETLFNGTPTTFTRPADFCTNQ